MQRVRGAVQSLRSVKGRWSALVHWARDFIRKNGVQLKLSRVVKSTREISTYREEYLTRILQTLKEKGSEGE